MNVNEVTYWRDLDDGYGFIKEPYAAPPPGQVTQLTPVELAARPARIAAEIAEDNGPREFRSPLARKFSERLARMTAECREKSLSLPSSKGPLIPMVRK